MAETCAVVGIGQTHHRKCRDDVSLAGLLREAALRALEDAEMGWKDVEAVVLGTAPDLFEGVMQPELYLADALGAVGKPILRVHTAGSVGGSTAVVAAHLIQSRIHERVLTVAFEKQSEGDTTWGLSGGRSGGVGAGGYFAPHIKAYIERSGAPEHVGWMVAVKDRRNALLNPYAHLQLKNIDIEAVKNSEMLWAPIRRLESCPASDGACAMVLCDERGGRRAPRPPAWVLGTAMRSENG
ncbi:MAG: thiolase domain-containing protein, partial [Proteobacteria bacterium]|nr:thiolase domain-containing protein [Pseudomonadota bacterium]